MQTSQNAPAAAPPAKAPSPRDLFVADMAAMRAPAEAKPAAKEPAPSEDDVPVDPLALADGGDPEADDAEATAAAVLAAAKDAPAPAKEEALDPAQAKRMEAAQREERRRKAERDAIRAEQAAALAKIEEERGSIAAERKAAEEFKALKAKAKANPLAAIEMLRELGYDDEAFVAVSHAAWAETPKGREDPRHKETAAKLAREREVGGGLAELQKKYDALEKRLEERDKHAATERAVNGYLDAAMEVAATGKVTEIDDEGNEIVAATVEAPIFKRWMKSDKAAARAQVMAVADELAGKAQREREPMPTPAEVKGLHTHRLDELLRRADLAMYQAKADGRNAFRFFDPDMQRLLSERLALEDDLKKIQVSMREQAEALVGAGVSAEDFAADPARYDIPDSVIGFLRGELGDPPGGWPEPLRTKALQGRGPAKPEQEVSDDDAAALSRPGVERQATLNRLLFPGPTAEFDAHRDEYGDTSQISANQFFYGLRRGEEHRVKLEKGVELLIGLEAISEPDDRGMRTVMCILNGQLRPVLVRDRSIAAATPAAEKADRGNPDHVAAPFAGVVTLGIDTGDTVEAGQTIATIEAMKMEAAITAPKSGTVQRIAVAPTAHVEGGDLLAVIS